MVVALFVLAFAMIAGGVAAVIQGYDIVLLERGWTLVIAGSVCASGGAVLLGVTWVGARLGRIYGELARVGERLVAAEHELPTAPQQIDPVVAVSSGLLAGGASEDPEPASVGSLPDFMRDEAKDAELPEEKRPANDYEAPEEASGTRLNLPRYLFGRRDEEPETGPPAPARTDASEDVAETQPAAETPDPATWPRGSSPLAFPSLARDNRASNPAFPRSVPPDATAGEDEGSPSTHETDADTTVIGSYESGDNRYVMFSDGSIEAETPDGTFRFGSLDELKEFIASGGEGGNARKIT